jgi:coenzyme F420 hydrogenase subunit beta
MSYADSWGGILSRHVQFRCKICPDGTGGFADVVCADA